MSNIEIAEICGLCPGCKNAISKAVDNIDSGKNVVLFKEIVHNKNVNLMLQNLGIQTIESLDNLPENSKVILRAHGEPPETYEFLNQNNIDFEDGTCHNVKTIHEQVEKFSNSGYTIIIIGKYGKDTGKIHPEIFGTIGWCKSEPILIETEDDLEKIKNLQGSKLYLTCQTTFNEKKADELIEKISQICQQNGCELKINKSICGAQKAINKSSAILAKKCDIMIVVGGKNSSNSKELFNHMNKLVPSIFIEDINDWLNEIKQNNIPFSNETKVGLTAGASTLKDELTMLKSMIEKEQKDLKSSNNQKYPY